MILNIILGVLALILFAKLFLVVPTNPYGIKEGPVILPPKGTHTRPAALSELVSVATLFGAPLVFMAGIAWRQPRLIAASVGLVVLFSLSTWASHAPVYRDIRARGEPVDDSLRARSSGTLALAWIMLFLFAVALALGWLVLV